MSANAIQDEERRERQRGPDEKHREHQRGAPVMRSAANAECPGEVSTNAEQPSC